MLNSCQVEFISVAKKRRIRATLVLIELMGGWSLGEGCGQSFLGCVSSDVSPGMDWSFLDLPFLPSEALF